MAGKRKRANARSKSSARPPRKPRKSTRQESADATLATPSQKLTAEQAENWRNARICIDARFYSAEHEDRAAFEIAYVEKNGGDVEQMRRWQAAQPNFALPHMAVVVDPRAAALQEQCMRAAVQSWQTLHDETQERIKRTSAETAETLHTTPCELEDLHAAAEISPARLYLQLAARAYRIDANASHKRTDIALERILRGALDALERGDVKRLNKIAKAAEPKQRDMHATPYSERRTEELEHLRAKLCASLAILWGATTENDLLKIYHENARRRGLKIEKYEAIVQQEFASFRAAPAKRLANEFVSSVELMPELFEQQRVSFSTAPRYNADGHEVLGPDPDRVAIVERVYAKRVKATDWTAGVPDDDEIRDQAAQWIALGLVALGLTREQAKGVVSVFDRRVDRKFRQRGSE